ncbi:MAG TPA: YeeE/YedE family protein [Gammaproteobacteria bacterium]
MSAATMNLRTIVIGAALSLIIAGHLLQSFGWRQAALFAVGLGAGVVLYHAAFGFTSAWRKLAVHGDSSGIRAQVVMLAVTAAIFLPLLASGELWGMELSPSNRPLGLSVIVGAFVFGVGMQLGGGCASGTLFTVGGGSIRMLATLAAFIAGSVLGALHRPAWEEAPGLAPVSLLGAFGLAGALLTTALLLAVIWFGATRFEQGRNGNVRSITATAEPGAWLTGPWPLVAGAVGLAAVNVATLVLAGRPWGVTSGFALWGSKIAAGLGVDVASWGYWQSPANAAALEGSVFANITSVMNFGIILGALIAAGLAGRFAPTWRVPARSLIAAIVGGILLGYGARIAYGCNIGAFFSGVSSSSLHGWLWLVAAFAGSTIATRMRPWFGMAN